MIYKILSPSNWRFLPKLLPFFTKKKFIITFLFEKKSIFGPKIVENLKTFVIITLVFEKIAKLFGPKIVENLKTFVIITLLFEKNPNFGGLKLSKNAKNCDHKIGPIGTK
jgi:hypothetical protein